MPFIYDTHNFIPINCHIPTRKRDTSITPLPQMRRRTQNSRRTPNRPSSDIRIQHTSIPAQDAATCLQANTNTARTRAHYTGKGAPQFSANQCPLAEAWVKSHTEEGGVCLSAFTALGQICQNSYVLRVMRIDAKAGRGSFEVHLSEEWSPRDYSTE